MTWRRPHVVAVPIPSQSGNGAILDSLWSRRRGRPAACNSARGHFDRTMSTMSDFEITGINKPHHQSPYEHITHIGNLEGHWRITRDSAIRRITGGAERYFTVDKTTGQHIPIRVVANDGGKTPYLKTRP
jgi:hypothetical protein